MANSAACLKLSEVRVPVFNVSGEVNRFDFGVKWDRKLDNGGLVVSENVKIEADIELNKSES